MATFEMSFVPETVVVDMDTGDEAILRLTFTNRRDSQSEQRRSSYTNWL